ncbi:MAG: DUF362 domain-containing protein, partial [Candidatus Aminicenantes bacterium]
MKKKEKKLKNASTSRRKFLKTLSGAAASVVVFGSCQGTSGNPDQGETRPTTYGPRAGAGNPYVNSEGKPILVCVEGSDFDEMLLRGLDAIGGLHKLVNNNQAVLIKPNLFEKSQYPWISSLTSITSIIQAVKQVSSGTVNVGDMSFEETSAVYDYLGIEDAVNNAGGTLLRFSQVYKVRRDSWPSSKPDFSVYADVYDTPVLINTPVLKRHYISSLTCAIKCNVGTIRGSGTTGTRAYVHYNSNDFMAELAEIAGLVKPDLNIVDARSIVTEIGPYYHQQGPLVDTNKIIICADIVATDAYCARLMEENDDSFSVSNIRRTLER